eukprot:NODE_6477_length_503_cov_197.881696.p2 GENE.NODE_6477_length_503_cov_197.881696~~NODE_6477_length_503_cov_197.881696.p2  ORF type:complete len:66 (-),score=11.23 NODE_6477_length_503_cov_197.881696:173-370(-)
MIAIGWDTWIILVIGIAAFVMAWFGAVYPLPTCEFYLGQPNPSIVEIVPDFGGVDLGSGALACTA